MSEKQYAVTISRFDENDEQEMLIDQYITADEAIDLMIHIKNNVSDASEEEEEEEEPEPVKAVTKKPKAANARNRYEPKPCCGSVGARHMKNCPANHTDGRAYSLKDDESEAAEPEEDPEKRKQRLFNKLSADEQEVVRMYNDERASKSEIYSTFPSIEVMRINDLINAYGNR